MKWRNKKRDGETKMGMEEQKVGRSNKENGGTKRGIEEQKKNVEGGTKRGRKNKQGDRGTKIGGE